MILHVRNMGNSTHLRSRSRHLKRKIIIECRRAHHLLACEYSMQWRLQYDDDFLSRASSLPLVVTNTSRGDLGVALRDSISGEGHVQSASESAIASEAHSPTPLQKSSQAVHRFVGNSKANSTSEQKSTTGIPARPGYVAHKYFRIYPRLRNETPG